MESAYSLFFPYYLCVQDIKKRESLCLCKFMQAKFSVGAKDTSMPSLPQGCKQNKKGAVNKQTCHDDEVRMKLWYNKKALIPLFLKLRIRETTLQ